MFPSEGSSWGIFSGLDALGEPMATTLASRIKAGAVELKPASAITTLFQPAPIDMTGGGLPLIDDGGAYAAGVTASDNSVIYIGLAVAALAIGGALYIKKRKKAA